MARSNKWQQLWMCVAATVPLDHFPGSNNGVLSVTVYYERICVVLIVWVGAPRHGQEQQVAAAVDVSLPLFLLITFQDLTTVSVLYSRSNQVTDEQCTEIQGIDRYCK
ncbi:hypothetical protein J6590_008056 [Homalodisca vitripennis]|nr:hypothetical protein J6590_008056 [Homalodisca vitripennis]